MFILMGAAIASTSAGADLYEALDRWLDPYPGGLVVSNLGACALFAAMSGSSPATCAAIGKMGIPEMRKRNFPDGVRCRVDSSGGHLGILIPLDHDDRLRNRHRNIHRYDCFCWRLPGLMLVHFSWLGLFMRPGGGRYRCSGWSDVYLEQKV